MVCACLQCSSAHTGPIFFLKCGTAFILTNVNCFCESYLNGYKFSKLWLEKKKLFECNILNLRPIGDVSFLIFNMTFWEGGKAGNNLSAFLKVSFSV